MRTIVVTGSAGFIGFRLSKLLIAEGFGVVGVDVMSDYSTWADASLLRRLTGYVPRTDIREGVKRFVAWHRDYAGA